MLSFEPTPEHIRAAREARLDRHSSLDRFVIPGRTRLPSSKTSISSFSSLDPTNIQIAQRLLEQSVSPSSHPASMGFLSFMAKRRGVDQEIRRSPPQHSSSGSSTLALDTTSHPSKYSTSHRSASGSDYQDDIRIPPHRRPEARCAGAIPHLPATSAITEDPEDPFRLPTDGPSDGAEACHPSSIVSGSWPTMSGFATSNYSSDSEPSKTTNFKSDYDTLARMVGLPPLSDDLSGKHWPSRGSIG